jgi:hypothetical protein
LKKKQEESKKEKEKEVIWEQIIMDLTDEEQQSVDKSLSESS